MTVSYVEYDLHDGFIDHWLTAGPQASPIQDLTGGIDETTKVQIIQKNYSAKPGTGKTPVERGPLSEGLFKIGTYEGSWSYARCAEDHTLDHSTTTATAQHVRAWAYTQLQAAQAGPAGFVLRTCGPVDVWINGKAVFHQEQFSAQPRAYAFPVDLEAGRNEVMLRFESVAAPRALLLVALRVSAEAALRVQIPSLIPSLERRAELEQVYQGIYLDRDVYASEDTIFLHWPTAAEKMAYNDVALKDETGFIFGAAEDVGKSGDTVFLGYPVTLAAGHYRAFVMPRAWEYYESNIRITQEIPAYVMGRASFSEGPYGSLAERSLEALTHAAGLENELYAEIAKMALNWWENIDTKVILKAIESVEQRLPGSPLLALGLLGMLLRHGAHEKFPQWLKKQLKASLVNYRYAAAEPGADLLDFDAEEQQILFAACQALAGQVYPNQVFARGGLSGRQLRQRGEQLALDWMQTHGQRGFSAWDTPEVYADSLTALSHLIEFSRAEPVWGLASVLMDKMLFSLALNSFKGAFGSTRGSARSLTVKSCLLDATSGLTRVLWGLGAFTTRVSAAVSLAQMEKYTMPANIADLAAGLPAELWSREQCGQADPVNKVTYRTPNGMLCSAQDYRPGQPGERQHIWQATLAPNCVVFSSHPGCSNEKEERAPNFWRGNGVLPRVAQWKDALVAVYRLPADDPMGFTHAYFPAASFDETGQRGSWMFGRKGDGFIALTASAPLEPVSEGRTARRELRAQGTQTIWLCQLGSTSQDGDFAAFQEKVAAAPCAFDGLQVTWQTARGETLSFGWEGDFQRDGETLPLGGFAHFENPYVSAPFPCEQMDINTGGEYVLRLDFSS
jgi:hypothetical protein